MNDNGTLTPKQTRAITALVTEADVKAAADAAKVGRRTLHRWMTEPAFRTALNVAEGALLDEATRRLLQLQAQAITTIEDILADVEASATVRLRAAGQVIDCMIRLRELRSLDERILALEIAQNETVN